MTGKLDASVIGVSGSAPSSAPGDPPANDNSPTSGTD
jgi:hypothetical protein